MLQRGRERWRPARSRHVRPSGFHTEEAPIDQQTVHRALEQLAEGTLWRLSALASNAEPAKGPPGVYTLWRGQDLLYCGMTYRDASETTNPQAAGVWGRLDTHRNLKRASSLGVQIMDRFIIPDLTPDELEALRRGERFLQDRLRAWIRDNVSYRVWVSTTGTEARHVERLVRRNGLEHVGLPLLNPA